MATEQINAIVSKVRNKLSKVDLSAFPEKYAVQVNLTGKIEGVFYIEVKDGILSVEPYEYIDKNCTVSASKTSLEKVISGKMAWDDEKVITEGSPEMLALLKNFA